MLEPTPDRRCAAIYLRISQGCENTRLGVDRHEEAAREMIDRRGWTFVDMYGDNDITGSGRKKWLLRADLDPPSAFTEPVSTYLSLKAVEHLNGLANLGNSMRALEGRDELGI